MLLNYLKIALRNLKKHKLFAFINIFGLAVGIAVCLLIFLYIQHETSYDRFHEKTPQLYRVLGSFDKGNFWNSITSPPTGATMAKEFPEIQATTRLFEWQGVIKKQGEPFEEMLICVDNDFLQMFSFSLLSGNRQNALKEPNSLVITEETALKHFGKKDVLGEVISLKLKDDFEPFKITGVMAEPPQNSTIDFNILISFEKYRQIYGDEATTGWMDFYLNTFVLLNPHTDINALEQKFPAMLDKYFGEAARKFKEENDEEVNLSFKLQALTDMHLNSTIGADNGLKSTTNPVYIVILSVIGVFILLIACINFINLTLAQSLPRSKEIGLRKIAGAGRKQLIAQFLGESLLLCSLAFWLGTGLVWLGLPVFNTFVDRGLTLSYLPGWQLFLASGMIVVITACLAGFYPAFVLSGSKITQVLKGKQKVKGRGFFTKGLVALQFTISLMLIIGTLGIYQQINYMQSKDLGYNDKNLLRVRLPYEEGSAVAPLLKDALSSNPNIESLTFQSGGMRNSPSEVNKKKMNSFHAHIDETYLSTLNLHLIEGRSFSAEYPSDTAIGAIVNEAFVKEAGLKPPYAGQEILFSNYGGRNLKIVGVVKDFHFQSLHYQIQPMLFHEIAQLKLGQMLIKVKPEKQTEVIAQIQQVWNKILPYEPFSYNFMDDINQRRYEEEQRWQKIITCSASFALVISLVGLLGLASLSIIQRTKEIGVRKVLGASLKDIIWVLTSEYNFLVIIGSVIAIPLAWYGLDKWLENFAYKMPLSVQLFAGAGLIVFITAFLTVAFQALRIGRTNPAESLKYE